jgi:hypothetical protein
VIHDHEGAVVVAGAAQVTGVSQPLHVRRQSQDADMSHVGRVLARVVGEQAVFFLPMRDLVLAPHVQVLRDRDPSQTRGIRLLPQPLGGYITVHRSHDRVDVHVNNRTHYASSQVSTTRFRSGAATPKIP